jgi:hypothetical protein
MTKGNVTIRAWLAQASSDQRKTLAKQANTSLMMLTHLAKGRVAIGADLAQRLAHAEVEGMDRLDVRDLCAVCRQCPLANAV